MVNPTTYTSYSFDLGMVPRHVHAVHDLLQPGAWTTADDLTRQAPARGWPLTPNFAAVCLRMLVDAGTVERARARGTSLYRLTQLGMQLRQAAALRPNVAADVLHFLFVSLCDLQRLAAVTVSGWSWIYQATCRLLWEVRPVVPPFAKQAAILSQRLGDARPEHASGVHRKSPNAVRFWLQELDPAFLIEQDNLWISKARSWCSPELLVLGLDLSYRLAGLPYGSPLLMDVATLDTLSSLCLVESDGLETALHLSVSTFGAVTTHMGEWGRSIILTRPLDASDVLG